MFPSLGSLTGGGGLSLSNSSSAKSGAENGGIYFSDKSGPFAESDYSSTAKVGLVVAGVVALTYVLRGK